MHPVTARPALHPGDVPAVADEPLGVELLQSVVDTARAIFGAQASSICLLDEDVDELVFHAVSGQGEKSLVGRRFPAGSGIAGWVAMSGEPIVVDDLSCNTRFNRELAESTAYVPDALMAAPLIHYGHVLGVLEVLDPAPQARSSLTELDVLALFARQAATGLRIAAELRAASGHRSAERGSVSDHGTAVRLVGELEQLLLGARAPGRDT